MRFLFCIVFATLSSLQTTSAQRALSLDECLMLAKENNKSIDASNFRMVAARYNRKSARANFMPTVQLTATGLYSTNDGSVDIAGGMLPVVGSDGASTGAGAYFPGVAIEYDVDWIYCAGIEVKQPIFTGGKITAGYRISDIAERIAIQERRLTETEVAVETARAYINVVKATEKKKVAVAYNELLKELMRSVKKANEHGAKARNDILKVEVRLNESELNLQRSDNMKRLAMMNLCHHIGVPLNEQIEVKTELPEIDMENEKCDISSRPEAQMLSLSSALAEQRTKLARSELMPKMAAVGMYGYANGAKLADTKLFDNWNFSAGIQLSIPLFNLWTYSKLCAAKAQKRATEAEAKDKMELLHLEAVQATNNLEEAAMEMSLAEKAVSSATENLRASDSRYKVGAESLSDHLEAQALWVQAKQSQIDTHMRRFLQWIEYCKAMGKL